MAQMLFLGMVCFFFWIGMDPVAVYIWWYFHKWILCFANRIQLGKGRLSFSYLNSWVLLTIAHFSLILTWLTLRNQLRIYRSNPQQVPDLKWWQQQRRTRPSSSMATRPALALRLSLNSAVDSELAALIAHLWGQYFSSSLVSLSDQTPVDFDQTMTGLWPEFDRIP